VRLILAHASDAPARALAVRWGDDALLLTPADLHARAWQLDLGRGGIATAAIGPDLPVTSVLSRLGGISPAELRRVQPEDRDYAAAELTAFLLAWLDACACPVLNRPGPGSLNGPGWRPEQWIAAAARAGLAVRAVHRHIEFMGAPQPAPVDPMNSLGMNSIDPVNSVSVTVVGQKWFGAVPESTGRRLCELARATGTPLLEAVLAGSDPESAVLAASAWPDIGKPQVADAVAVALGGG
jgi:hypothetical protein